MYRSVCTTQNYYFTFYLMTQGNFYVVIKTWKQLSKLKLLKFSGRFKAFDIFLSGNRWKFKFAERGQCAWNFDVEMLHFFHPLLQGARFLIKNVFGNMHVIKFLSTVEKYSPWKLHVIHHFQSGCCCCTEEQTFETFSRHSCSLNFQTSTLKRNY